MFHLVFLLLFASNNNWEVSFFLLLLRCALWKKGCCLYRFRSTEFDSNWNRKWCGRPTLALPSYIFRAALSNTTPRRWGTTRYNTYLWHTHINAGPVSGYAAEACIHYPRAQKRARSNVIYRFSRSPEFCWSFSLLFFSVHRRELDSAPSCPVSFCCNPTCAVCVCIASWMIHMQRRSVKECIYRIRCIALWGMWEHRTDCGRATYPHPRASSSHPLCYFFFFLLYISLKNYK